MLKQRYNRVVLGGIKTPWALAEQGVLQGDPMSQYYGVYL